VQRFVLQENIKNFRARLAEASEDDVGQRLSAMLAAAERELSLHDASAMGVLAPWQHASPEELAAGRTAAIAAFHAEFDHTDLNASLLDPAPGLVFVEVGGVDDVAAGRPRSGLIGRALFTLFPENPDDPSAEGVRLLYQALRGAAETGKEQSIPVFRYDVQAAGGSYGERWWRAQTRPIFDDEGRLIFVSLLSEDVTEEVLAQRRSA
jgi:PAS domain-containing protein